MDLKDVLHGRRSIRRYEERPISREQLTALIESAEEAPSAGNLRSRRYFIISKAEMRKAIALAAYRQQQIETAPILIVSCADVARSSARYGDRGSLYAIQDATAATMCLLLAAYSLGLGACWNGAFDDELVREALNLSSDLLPVAIISLGWPNEVPFPPPRRPLGEMISWVV